jgi:hypothetical protein
MLLCGLVATSQELALDAKGEIDDYQEYKIKKNISKGLRIKIDTMFATTDTLKVEIEGVMMKKTKTRLHVDYTLQNQSDQILVKTEFKLLFVNGDDTLEHDLDVAYYNVISPGEQARIRKVSSIKDFLVVNMDNVVDTVIVLEEVYIVVEEDGLEVNKRIEFK